MRRSNQHSAPELGAAFVEYLVLVAAVAFLAFGALPAFTNTLGSALVRADAKLKYAGSEMMALEGGGTQGTVGPPPASE
jgi:hypothetical protein